ncbi:MAG TPA: GNVR domain-containing protein [Vicinamibacterales bacterium]|jgi:polysaccharide chain length determinant protein (PEP-CTERM system associated)|nr:GNVR domain-containing protein [Vicinamibacterales bacterium]
MDEPRFDPLDYVSAFNRRKWWFIVPVVLSVIIGGLLVWTLPREYQATAMVAVSGARVASNVVGTVEIDRQERMRAVSQQLLSRNVLEKTARLEHLDQRDGTLDIAVAGMRSQITVALPDSITGSGLPQQLSPDQKAQLDSYLITYADATPEDAKRVVNRLAQVFVEENSKSREVRAQDTSEFIANQLKSSEGRLGALEAKLRDMKESYMGRLPEQTSANLQMVSGLQQQLESTATAMRGEQDRLSMLERQMESMQQGADDSLAAARGTPSETAQMRVVALRRELSDAQLNFTDKHPEVIRLKEELATADKAAAAERSRPAADRLSLLQSSPDYRQLVKDRDATKMRLDELQRHQAQITSSISNYQARVEAAPRVEQQLVSLQREYDLERGAYSDLSQKKQAALLSEDLQRKQGGEQFLVLAPASLPTEPSKPKPARVMLMALAAGFVLGGAGVMGREYLDRSVHDARGLRDEFELPVLAEIPRIEPVLS